MPGAQRPDLRIVGGNEALVRMTRLSREVRWPPLRVVGIDDMPLPPAPIVPRVARDMKRASWSQALLAGALVVFLSSVGQAIASYL